MAANSTSNGSSNKAALAAVGRDEAAVLESGNGVGYQSLPQLSPPHAQDEEDGSGNGSRVRASLERFRWGEILVLLAILLLSFKGLGQTWDRRQYLPKVTQTLPDGSTVVLANATMFSYPIKFYGGSLECAPVELDYCRIDATPKCCDFMRTGSAPFQTITVPMLGVLAILVPVILILLRHALLRRYAPNAESSLRDVALAFFFTVSLTQAATNMVKSLVTQPRPNHYALRIFASLCPPGYVASHYDSTAWHAFPSGHCSLSMAALLFVSLLFISDVRHAGRLQHEHRAVLVTAACLPIFLALYIAASRIFDYYHSSSEATCGMLFGGFWAVLGFLRVMPYGESPHRPLKWF